MIIIQNHRIKWIAVGRLAVCIVFIDIDEYQTLFQAADIFWVADWFCIPSMNYINWMPATAEDSISKFSKADNDGGGGGGGEWYDRDFLRFSRDSLMFHNQFEFILRESNVR